MTDEDLKSHGWCSQLCKVGTLYFLGDYFCKLEGEEVILYHISCDTIPLGRAKTFYEISVLKMIHEEHEITIMERKLKAAKQHFCERFGITIEDYRIGDVVKSDV